MSMPGFFPERSLLSTAALRNTLAHLKKNSKRNAESIIFPQLSVRLGKTFREGAHTTRVCDFVCDVQPPYYCYETNCVTFLVFRP